MKEDKSLVFGVKQLNGLARRQMLTVRSLIAGWS